MCMWHDVALHDTLPSIQSTRQACTEIGPIMAVPCAFPHTSPQGRLLRLPTRLHGLLELQLLLNATANE